jgi:hypothetical protein
MYFTRNHAPVILSGAYTAIAIVEYDEIAYLLLLLWYRKNINTLKLKIYIENIDVNS